MTPWRTADLTAEPGGPPLVFIDTVSWTREGPPRRSEIENKHQSESRVDAQPGDDGRVDVLEPTSDAVELLREARLDDLQVEGRVHRRCDREVVVHLHGVFLVEAEVEPLPQERDEIVAELGARPADPERVVRAAGHQSVAAEAHVVGIFDRVGVSVGGPEAEERPDPTGLVAPQVLVEVVVDGPGVVFAIQRLDRHKELREESLEDPPEYRAGICKPRKPADEEYAFDVRGILLERRTFLVVPGEPHQLMADQAERLDGDAALRRDQHAVLERFADVVVARRAARINDADREHS